MTDTTKECVERLAKRAEAAAVEYRTRFPCCGERDTLGTCAAPACHFGEVLNGLTRQAKALRDLVKERDALAAEVATLRQRDAAMRAALIAAKEASEFAVAVSAATPDGEAIEPQLASKAEWMFVKAHRLRDAALSAAPPASPWRDIATAPKDGTLILLGWRRDDDFCTDVGWWEGGVNDRCWYASDNDRVLPTHWMPLPERPAAQAGEPGA